MRKKEKRQPLVMVGGPTYSGEAYALKPWADAFKAQTYENKAAFMVDNSDGPATGGNLHYLHMIRGEGIPAVWQTVRFPFLWDTLELSHLLLIEHAHEIGADFFFSVEADVVLPPDATQLMVDASLANAVGGKPACVSQRYHPRAQDGPDFWWDTLGCTLFPVAPLYEDRHLVHSIYELDVYEILKRHGYPRFRPGHGCPDLFIPEHLRDPNDQHAQQFGATSALTRYHQRVIDGNKRKDEMEEETVTPEEPTPEEPTPEDGMQMSASIEMSPAVLTVSHGEPETEPEAPAMPLEQPYPFDVGVHTDEEIARLLKQERIRLNIGSDIGQIAGFLNVDFNPEVKPDICTDATDLSIFEDGTVDEILASHILEHLTWDDGLVALKEWLRVLKPGGLLTVATPDVTQVYMLMKHGAHWGEYQLPIDETYVQATIFGANLLADKLPEMRALYGGPGHRHQSFYMQDMLLNRVLQGGFVLGHEVGQCFLRPSSIGETMVQAFKADTTYEQLFGER